MTCMKTFFLVSLLLIASLPGGVVHAAFDPAEIQSYRGGGVCGTDVNGGAGTPVSGGYFNVLVTLSPPSTLPAGFLDAPSRYCYQETETWINQGTSLGGDTINQYQWYRYNATYTAKNPDGSILFPTAYRSQNNIRENWAFAAAPTQVTASLVANPNAIVRGENSLLTWSSTGATSCTGTNFSTGGATSGSVRVTPPQTTTYSVTCTTSSGTVTTPPTVINHGEADAYNSQGVIADMQASGINLPAVQGNTGFANDQVTMNRVCELIDGAGSTASNIGARSYNSPGNNGVVSYSSSGWVRTPGVRLHMSTSFSCEKPGTTSSRPGQSASASATVLVSSPSTTPSDPCMGGGGGGAYQVSCRVSPGTVTVGQQVVWTATVTGAPGTYTYSWSGTDGLSGSSNQIVRSYATAGQKTGSLTVTYAPDLSTCSAPPTSTPPPAPTPPPSSSPAPTATPPPPTNTPTTPSETIPRPQACATIGWSTPFSPCSGAWLPTFTNGCQSGWQCVSAPSGGGGGSLPLLSEPTLYDSFINLFNFEPPQIQRVPEIQDVQGSVLPGYAESTTVQCENALSVQNGPCTGPSCPGNQGTGGVGGGVGGGGAGSGGAGGPGGSGNTECSDGVDNNGDGRVDTSDPFCSSAADTSERTEPAELSLRANPPLIKKNQACTIELSAVNVSSCTLTGTNVSRTFTAQGGAVQSTQVVTPPLAQTATYTLRCTGLDGISRSQSVDCRVAPTFQEI